MTHHYKLVEVIGSGSYGIVYKAIHIPTNLFVAVKMLEKDKLGSVEKQAEFRHEIKMLKGLNHPFISKIFDFFKSANHYYIVMEYCSNGNLHDLIQNFQKIEHKNAMYIFIQLVSVLEYLHLTKHIIHRDLKPKNILFDKNYNIRLIDFGFSKKFQAKNEMFHTFCGTSEYMSPEMIQGQSYSTKTDVWSLGIILYEMIVGKRPFENSNTNQLFQNIQESEPDYTGVSYSLRDLVENMLKKNLKERISLRQIKNYYSIQKTYYYQSLNETLSTVMEKKEEDLIDNLFNDNLKKENCSIMKQILAKDKVTDLIRCVNHLNIFTHEQNSFAHIKPTQDEKEEKQLIMKRQDSPLKYLKPVTIRYYPQTNAKKENYTQFSNQKRYKSTQNTNRKNHDSPLFKFPFTNFILE